MAGLGSASFARCLEKMCYSYWAYSPIPSHPVSLAILLWIIDVTTMSPSLPQSLTRQPPVRISKPDWVSQEHSLHTIPVTISNKAEQGEGQDAPWHLNQLLSYNNSMIFNISLLPSPVKRPKKHSPSYHGREEQQQLNESLNMSRYFSPDGKNVVLISI